MKKFQILIIISFFAFSANAQFGAARNKSIFVGVKAGANFSKIETEGLSVSKIGSSAKDFWSTNAANRTGYVFGVYGRFGKKIYLQPELLLSTKGGTVDVLKAGSTSPVSVDVKFSQLDIPILLGYKLGPLRVNAGPVASLNLSQNTALADALKAYTSQSISKTVQQSVIGYQAGAGLDLGSFNIDLRYEGSLSNLSQLNLQNNAQFNTKASLWQLSIGMVLF